MDDRRRVAVRAGLLGWLVLVLTACTVTVDSGHGPANTVGVGRSVLVDNTLTLDLRTRHPSRADFGMDATSSYAGYGSTSKPVRVVVLLPTGRLEFDRADVTAATDGQGGATERNPALAPTYFTVTERYDSAAAARAAAVPRAPALGLSMAQVDEALRNDSGMFDAQGRPDGWHSERLSFTGGSNPTSYDGNYFFDLDVFHNTAVDAISHDGVVDLDLRTPPSRAAVGFRTGYTMADVQPLPGRSLTLALRTPTGSGRLGLPSDDSVSSDADGPAAPPAHTGFTVCTTPDVLPRRLLAVSGLFGWSRSRVAALPHRVTTENTTIRVQGSTSTFDALLKYEPSSGDGLDSCATITLTYRR